MLTKEDLKKQTEWYDDELSHLQSLIAENEQNNKQYSRQKEQMDDLEKMLDEILSFNEENEMLYREILEKIVVCWESEKQSLQRIFPGDFIVQINMSKK